MRVSIGMLRVGETEVSLPPKGVTAIVGGNNVGKSTLLRELHAAMLQQPGMPQPAGKVVAGLSLTASGNAQAALAWMKENAHFQNELPNPGFVSPEGGRLPESLVAHNWGQRDRLGLLTQFLVHYSEPLGRQTMVHGVGARQNITDAPTHPLHRLADDAALLAEISDISEQVFRVPLTLDRLSGSNVLRVGKTDVPAPPIDAVTRQYRDALAALPPLPEQGQGMVSMFGLLLPVLTAARSIVLIDEPEAFLHPPQAFQLGRLLARIAIERSVQVIVATHDRSLLAGLLEPSVPLSIVRLDRTARGTSAFQLAPEDVSTLWTDPVLRYSNVLDGVFHKLVVVAESDGDCRYLNAALDALDSAERLTIAPSEVLFVPAGGKDGMAKIVRALRAVRVKVVASPDLDILDDETKIRRLVEAFDGDWSRFSAEYAPAMAQFRPQSTAGTCGEVLDAVTALLVDHRDEPWTQAQKDRIKVVLRTAQSRLSELKRYGMRAFQGDGAAHAVDLLDKLATLGICPLRDGELENLAPTLGVGKGPAWLAKALEQGAHQNGASREHVTLLLRAAGVVSRDA